MTALLTATAAALLTVFSTRAAADRARTRLRLAYHRRLTRRHGRMLQRASAHAVGGREW